MFNPGWMASRCIEFLSVQFRKLRLNMEPQFCRKVRKKIGHPISYANAQIAAIASQHGYQLATRNIVDFQFIEDLVPVNPWENPR